MVWSCFPTIKRNAIVMKKNENNFERDGFSSIRWIFSSGFAHLFLISLWNYISHQAKNSGT